MLGLGKTFVIFIIISMMIGLATKNWQDSAIIMGTYIICIIVWRFLTGINE